MSPRAGFTLLELLIAMTLLGLVGIMAAGGVRFGLAAWERGSEHAGAAIETRQALKAVRRLLNAARPLSLRTSADREPAILFTGTPKMLRFAAPLPAALAQPGDFLVQLRLEGDRLMLRAAPLGHDTPDLGAETLNAVLMDGLSSAEFRYFGALPRDETNDAIPSLRWQSVWTGRTILPSLVALDLTWAKDAPLAQHPARRASLVARLGSALALSR